MNGRERVHAMLEGRPVDTLPAMPITMMFAADQIGAKYYDYATNYRVLADAQVAVAERFDFDYVSVWIEGPCAEGADLRGINTLMLDFYDDPAFVRDLFEFIVEVESRFARFQVAMGADLIGVGDAAASLVGPKLYNELVWPYEREVGRRTARQRGLRRGCTSAGTRGRSSRGWEGCGVPWLTWIGFLRCPRDGNKWDRSRSSWATSIPCEFSKRERPNPFMQRSGSVISRLETDSLSGRVVKCRGGRRQPT